MAHHNVYFELPERELGKVDTKFSIYQNEEKPGETTISKSVYMQERYLPCCANVFILTMIPCPPNPT
jgi:hypothetical protein